MVLLEKSLRLKHKESVLAEGFPHRSQWKIVTLCSTYDFSTLISVFSLSVRVSQ